MVSRVLNVVGSRDRSTQELMSGFFYLPLAPLVRASSLAAEVAPIKLVESISRQQRAPETRNARKGNKSE